MRIIVLALLALSFGCSSNDSISYKRTLNELIPKELHGNLPNNIGEQKFKIFFELEPETGEVLSNLTTIYLSYSFDNMDSLLTDVKKESIGTYKFQEECNLTLYRFQEGTINTGIKGSEWLYDEWVDSLDNCQEKRYPIPNFVNAGEGEFEYKRGISKDYTLYVTEAKQGKHFDDKYYAEEIIMPKGWERGYSQGYAINEKQKKVIYWFVIW